MNKSIYDLAKLNQEMLVEEIHTSLKIPITEKYNFLLMCIYRWEYDMSANGGDWTIFKIDDTLNGHSNILYFVYEHEHVYRRPARCSLRIPNFVHEVVRPNESVNRDLLSFACKNDLYIYDRLDDINKVVFNVLERFYQ